MATFARGVGGREARRRGERRHRDESARSFSPRTDAMLAVVSSWYTSGGRRFKVVVRQTHIERNGFLLQSSVFLSFFFIFSKDSRIFFLFFSFLRSQKQLGRRFYLFEGNFFQGSSFFGGIF